MKNLGRAVIQTFTPENETIRQAARQDYESFYRAEIELRRLQALPPFTELLCITMSGREESLVLGCAAKARDELLDATRSESGVRVLGPAPLSVLRVNNNYRYRVTLCARRDADCAASWPTSWRGTHQINSFGTCPSTRTRIPRIRRI